MICVSNTGTLLLRSRRERNACSVNDVLFVLYNTTVLNTKAYNFMAKQQYVLGENNA